MEIEEKIVPSENDTIKFNRINKSRDIQSQTRNKMNQNPRKPQRFDSNIEDVNVKVLSTCCFSYLHYMTRNTALVKADIVLCTLGASSPVRDTIK